MLGVDEGYRKRGISTYLILSSLCAPFLIISTMTDSFYARPPFYQRHADWWRTRSKLRLP